MIELMYEVALEALVHTLKIFSSLHELGYNPRPLKEGLTETLQHELRLLKPEPESAGLK
jgi:hypothetical protein